MKSPSGASASLFLVGVELWQVYFIYEQPVPYYRYIKNPKLSRV